jgi:hypothetical protein
MLQNNVLIYWQIGVDDVVEFQLLTNKYMFNNDRSYTTM